MCKGLINTFQLSNPVQLDEQESVEKLDYLFASLGNGEIPPPLVFFASTDSSVLTETKG